MALSLRLPTALGATAAVTTTALVAVQALLAHDLVSAAEPPTSIIAIVAAAAEGVVLVTISTHLLRHIRRQPSARSADEKNGAHASLQRPGRSGFWFGLTILTCTGAAALSVGALASLGRSINTTDTIFGSGVIPFLAGYAVTLGVCFATQLIFLIVVFIASRDSSSQPMPTSYSLEAGDSSGFPSPVSGLGASKSRLNLATFADFGKEKITRPGSSRVKSIPYSQTTPAPSIRSVKKPSSVRSRSDSAYAEAVSYTPPGSSGGQSVANTVRSVRPASSRSRLTTHEAGDAVNFTNHPIYLNHMGSVSRASSHRSLPRRFPSLNTGATGAMSAMGAMSAPGMARASTDDFDSWDTSSSDVQTRQTALESAASPALGLASRFLETIPASPVISHPPSPDSLFEDLEPPRTRRRSRSFSPAGSISSLRSQQSQVRGRARAQSHSQTPPTAEAHIHPLFRSDSPNPPPAVSSAGTVVTAAPNGGQMLAPDARSLRTLTRMRSGSLPTTPSPLSQQDSFEDFRATRGLNAHLDFANRNSDASDASDANSEVPERQLTPPIPEWIMSAGSRTSLSGYQSRRGRVQDGAP